MDTVAAGEQYSEERADWYLSYLEAEWASIPDIDREWDSWEEPDRLDFVLEWPLRADTLGTLRRWVAKGLLTKEQQARYEELLKLMERNRPILERLLSEE